MIQNNIYHQLAKRELGMKPKNSLFTEERIMRHNIRTNNVAKTEKTFQTRIEAVDINDKLGLIAIATLSQVALYNIEEMSKPMWEKQVSSEIYEPSFDIPFIKILPPQDQLTRASIVWGEQHYRPYYLDSKTTIWKVIVSKDGVNDQSMHHTFSYVKEICKKIAFVGERLFCAPHTTCYELEDSIATGEFLPKQISNIVLDEEGHELRAMSDRLVCTSKSKIFTYCLQDQKVEKLGVRGSFVNTTTVATTNMGAERLVCSLQPELLDDKDPRQLGIINVSKKKIEYKNATPNTTFLRTLLYVNGWYFCFQHHGAQLAFARNWSQDRAITLDFISHYDGEGAAHAKGQRALIANIQGATLFHVSDDVTKVARINYNSLKIYTSHTALSDTRLCVAANNTINIWNLLSGKKEVTEEEQKENIASLVLSSVETRKKS